MPSEYSATQLGTYALHFLKIDTRPTFIVSIPSEYSTPAQPGTVLFANDALRDIERRGELSMSPILAEGFLNSGGGSFPSGKWRFTAVPVGGGIIKRGSIMVVTVESMPVLEWGLDYWVKEVNGCEMVQPEKGRGEEANITSMSPVPAASMTNGYKSNSSAASNSSSYEDQENRKQLPITKVTVSPEDSDCKDERRMLGNETNGKDFQLIAVEPMSGPFSISPESKFKMSQQSSAFMDWTRGISPLQTSQHYYNLRQVDWSKTSYGPYSEWSPVLRLVAISIMTMPYPTAFYWGSDYTILYNEQWRTIAQNKDPELLGKTFSSGWPELASYFLPLLDAAYHRGQGTVKEAKQFCLHRGDLIEECYFDFSVCAVVGEEGTPVGVLEQAFEHTRQIVSARRMVTLQRMGELLGAVKDLDEDDFWTLVLEAFDDNHMDSPFVLLYRTVEGQSPAGLCPSSNVNCVLVGNTGLPEGGYIAPRECNLGDNCGYFLEQMREAKEMSGVVLKDLDFSDIREMDNVVYRGFGDTPRSAAIIPIQATKTTTQGFLILGLNPRRPYDGDYKLWISMLKKELATTTGRVLLLKGEIAKAISEETERVAKVQAIELQEQLEKRTAELRDSELLFTRIAETIPVGLALLSTDGSIFFRNDSYFQLTSLPKGSDADAWREAIYEEDRAHVYQYFRDVVKSRVSMQWETRVGYDPSNPQGWKYWCTCSVVPQTNRGPDGEEILMGYILTLADITSIKLNEEYQRQLSTQAVERRRQQENFIDVFSHELRNPFSATLQCADGILSALMEFQNNGEKEHGLDVEEMIDSASTILVCVQHQMRIIDDVLTLSKLDSMLLSVVPVDVQMHETVSQIMKIFQSELHVKRITCEYLIENSYKELAVDWVKADPSRFSQILMNLITNAIKFTSLQTGKRQITTRLGASLERPTGHGTVVYRNGDQVRLQDIPAADWGSGEVVYILITVEDSGIGISEEWQKKLFKRFEQVPRTHVTYGGSGLGLFICRQLCRIQGGEIGVYSQEGRGSSFSFYIRARRSTGPPDAPRISPRPQPSPRASSAADRKMSKFEEIATAPAGQVGVVAMKTYPRPFQPGAAVREQVSYNVLIVEDNLINQEVLRRQLRKEGCITHVAGNGEEALKLIAESVFTKQEGGIRIDIVLMDMEMPVMDGNTATLKIREMEREGVIKRHVPIMGISANARPEQVAKMTEAGMDDAISKPFRIADLLTRFDTLLKKLQERTAADQDESLDT